MYKKDMTYSLRRIDEVSNFSGKTVLVRIDADVIVENGMIMDDTRLVAGLDTINYIMAHGGKVILLGHMGRPERKFKIQNSKFKIDEENKLLSLEPVARWFVEKLNGTFEETITDKFPGWKITDAITLIENIRFFQGEEENDSEFSKELAALGDIYVNESFATTHRKQASTYGIAQLLPSYAGFRVAREVEVLSKVMEDPQRPFVVIIAGAKLETKLPVVSQMHKIADFVLVGGKIAPELKTLMKEQPEKFAAGKSIIIVADLDEGGKDISEKSAEEFVATIQKAKTIVWNGPVGLMGEDKKYEEGTRKLAEAIVQSSAYKVVGGGDTLAYLTQKHLLDKFDFFSVGGGAMLEFLEGKQLPGIIPLLK